MANIIRYVDPDVVGGAGNGTSWANAYASLNQWETAEQTNLVLAGNTHTVYCRNSLGSADTTAFGIGGWTTDATHYIAIIGDNPNAYYTAGRYRLECAAACINIQEEFVNIQNIQVKAGAGNCFNFFIVGAAVINISKNIFYGSTTSNLILATTSGGAGSRLNIWNNVMYGAPAGLSAINMNDADVSFYIFNNTIYNCGRGITNTACAAHYIRNNRISATDCFNGVFTDDDAINDYNFITENDLNNALGSHGAKQQTFGYKNIGILDLTPTVSDPCVNTGENEAASLLLSFTDDKKSETRSGSWDVGALEFVPDSNYGCGGLQVKLELCI